VGEQILLGNLDIQVEDMIVIRVEDMVVVIRVEDTLVEIQVDTIVVIRVEDMVVVIRVEDTLVEIQVEDILVLGILVDTLQGLWFGRNHKPERDNDDVFFSYNNKL